MNEAQRLASQPTIRVSHVPEISTLDEACGRGLVNLVSASSVYIGNQKRSAPKPITTWMIYSDLVFYSSCKNTWLPSGERIIINRGIKDRCIAMSDNLHGLSGEKLNKELDQSSQLDISSATKIKPLYDERDITILLSTQWSESNIFHLILDCLAKLSIAEKVYEKERICVLVPNGSRLIELLKLLDYKYQPYKRNELFKGKVAMPSMPHFTGNIPIDTKLFLTRATSHFEVVYSNAIYVSRKAGRNRSILNEDDLLLRMQKIIHIDVVRLEDLSIKEQIRLMKGVSIVIAPHGAGLCWLAFNRNPCHVFEIFSSDYVNRCFDGITAPGSHHIRYTEEGTTQNGGFNVNIENIANAFDEFIEQTKALKSLI
jgi:hypothetical protein